MKHLILIALLLLAACGGGDPEEGDQTFVGPTCTPHAGMVQICF